MVHKYRSRIEMGASHPLETSDDHIQDFTGNAFHLLKDLKLAHGVVVVVVHRLRAIHAVHVGEFSPQHFAVAVVHRASRLKRAGPPPHARHHPVAADRRYTAARAPAPVRVSSFLGSKEIISPFLRTYEDASETSLTDAPPCT